MQHCLNYNNQSQHGNTPREEASFRVDAPTTSRGGLLRWGTSNPTFCDPTYAHTMTQSNQISHGD